MINIYASPHIQETKRVTKRMTRRFESRAVKSKRNTGEKRYSLSVTVPNDGLFFMKDTQTFLCHPSQLAEIEATLKRGGFHYRVVKSPPLPPLNLSMRPPKIEYEPLDENRFFMSIGSRFRY